MEETENGKAVEFTLCSISYVRISLQIKHLKITTLRFSSPKPSKNCTKPNFGGKLVFARRLPTVPWVLGQPNLTKGST